MHVVHTGAKGHAHTHAYRMHVDTHTHAGTKYKKKTREICIYMIVLPFAHASLLPLLATGVNQLSWIHNIINAWSSTPNPPIYLCVMICVYDGCVHVSVCRCGSTRTHVLKAEENLG